jgi:hypothetical protein
MPGQRIKRLHELIPQLRAASFARSKLAAQFLQAQLRRDVGKRYPPASRPGQPPARRTGAYQASLYARPIKGGGGVVAGSEMPRLFRWLNLGTRRMAARPHFERTVLSCRARILQILRGQ